jgi:hypothetical protein
MKNKVFYVFWYNTVERIVMEISFIICVYLSPNFIYTQKILNSNYINNILKSDIFSIYPHIEYNGFYTHFNSFCICNYSKNEIL